MTDTGTAASPLRFEVRATTDSHFSWLRTRLSAERTLMSWVRTAISLIGFGFTIAQFFQRFEQTPGVGPGRFSDAPWYFGLALIFCGVMALVISIWEYRWTLKYLWSENFVALAGVKRHEMQTPLYAVSITLAVIGSLTFFAILFRVI
jgi:putative membrane protein